MGFNWNRSNSYWASDREKNKNKRLNSFYRVHEMRDENNELPGNFLSELYKWALECECWFLLNNLHSEGNKTNSKKKKQTIITVKCSVWMKAWTKSRDKKKTRNGNYLARIGVWKAIEKKRKEIKINFPFQLWAVWRLIRVSDVLAKRATRNLNVSSML